VAVRGTKAMNRHKKQYPVKTTVNLLYKERSNSSIVRTILVALALGVVLAVFTKFAVIDRLAAAGRALRQAEELEMQLLEVQLSNMDYEDVLQEYQHYYFSISDREGENSQGTVYVECQDVLDLLDEELLHKAGIQMVNLSGNVLTVNLTRINLERASDIAKSLKENEMVEEVMVSAANKKDEAEGTTVYLNIILKTENQGAEEDE